MPLKSNTPRRQKGAMLVEALIGILLISVGVLGVVGLQASSIAAVTESKYRADAAFLANQILSRMWADNPANLANYQNNASGTGCDFSGTPSTNTNVINWLGASDKAGTVYGTLPGSSDSTQQIKVGTGNTVAIVLCWKSPSATAFHSFTIGTQINGTAP